MDVQKHPLYPSANPYSGVCTFTEYNGDRYRVAVVRYHDSGELGVHTELLKGVPSHDKHKSYPIDQYPEQFTEQVQELLTHLG